MTLVRCTPLHAGPAMCPWCAALLDSPMVIATPVSTVVE